MATFAAPTTAASTPRPTTATAADSDTSLNWAMRELQEVHNHSTNSTIWRSFEWRGNDIIVATWQKSGTTWMQQLVGQILSHGDPDYDAQSNSPWLDHRSSGPDTLAMLKALPTSHRRVIKTHLPSTALPHHPTAKVIVVMRDGRDACWSIHNHHMRILPQRYERINGPGLIGDPLPPNPEPDQRAYFLHWLRHDGKPFWPFFSHVRSWWELRHHPNVLLVHFNSLKSDFEAEAKRVAAFLEVDVPAECWPAIVQHCTIEWMRAHADKAVPMAGTGWEGGAEGFLFKGTNGRWVERLTPEDVAEYETRAREELGEVAAQWLAAGLPANPKGL